MAYEVAVIVPTHERPNLLERSLRSVGRAVECGPLSASEVEIIVVDDAHQDEIQDVVREFGKSSGPAARYLRTDNGPHSGAAHARNCGMRCSTAKYIYFLDDDDEFLPCRFNESLPILRKGLYEVVLESAYRQAAEGSDDFYVSGPSSQVGEDAFSLVFSSGSSTHVATGATSFLREVIFRLGGLDERLRYGEDFEFLVRLCLCARVLLNPNVVCKIYRHTDNTSRSDRLAYWQTMKVMSLLFRKAGGQLGPAVGRLLSAAVAGKLDYLLSKCRDECTYVQRIHEGARILRYFDPRCLSLNNIKTIVVWLLKPGPRDGSTA